MLDFPNWRKRSLLLAEIEKRPLICDFVQTSMLIGGSRPAPGLYHAASLDDTVDRTVYSFSNVDIGVPTTDRIVILAVQSDNGSYTDSKINGSTANERVNSTGGSRTSRIVTKTITTGTTCSIDIDYSTSAAFCHVEVYVLYGAASEVPSGTSSGGAASGTSIDLTITSVATGRPIVACAQKATTGTISWTGVTSDYNADEETRHASVASGLTSGSSHTITPSWSGSTGNRGAAACWTMA